MTAAAREPIAAGHFNAWEEGRKESEYSFVTHSHTLSGPDVFKVRRGDPLRGRGRMQSGL